MSEPQPLLRMRLRVQHDVFVVRQLGREVARSVGMQGQDQTRLATALSEVARLVLADGGNADVAFVAVPSAKPTLWIEIISVTSNDGGRLAPQLQQVGRLVDTMEVGDDGTGTVVRMSRRLPSSAPPLTPAGMDEIRAELAAHMPGTPLDELAIQNQQLTVALDDVRAQRDDLARLNVELQEPTAG